MAGDIAACSRHNLSLLLTTKSEINRILEVERSLAGVWQAVRRGAPPRRPPP